MKKLVLSILKVMVASALVLGSHGCELDEESGGFSQIPAPMTCEVDGDCANDWHCDVDSEICVECYSDMHCPMGEQCTDHVCEPQQIVASCSATGKCPQGNYCHEGECYPIRCLPLHDFCVGHVIWTCNVDGSGGIPGTECDPGDACTYKGGCSLGHCVEPVKVDCDDGNPCTDDLCYPDSGCKYKFNSADCDDNDPCTVGDKCHAGQCVSGAVIPKCVCSKDADCTKFDSKSAKCTGKLECSTGGKCQLDLDSVVECPPLADSCYRNVCDWKDGKCYEETSPAGTECFDGDPCSEDDACLLGVCAGLKKTCDDGNECSDDWCAEDGTCEHETVMGMPCASKNACSVWSVCDETIDGLAFCRIMEWDPCNDGDPCTLDGQCKPASGCDYSLTDPTCSNPIL